MAQNMVYLVSAPRALEKNMYSTLGGWIIPKITVRSSWFIELFRSSLSLLISFLPLMSVSESRMLKVPTIIMDLYLCFKFHQFFFTYFKGYLLGSFIFRIVCVFVN